MERVIGAYEKLFSIRFTHGAFPSSGSGDWLNRFMKIVPDRLTAELFERHDIHFRLRQEMLFCFIRVRPDAAVPFFRLPALLNLRFLFDLKGPLLNNIQPDPEELYRIRINLRASADRMELSTAPKGKFESRSPDNVFQAHPPGFISQTAYVKGHTGIIDIVTEGSASHRIFTDTTTQRLFYAKAGGNMEQHLFTLNL